MLQPSKHSHPDRTVLHVAVLLLAQLKERRVECYEDLKANIKNRVKGGEQLLLPALGLLYLLGLADYRPKGDIVEYLGAP